MESITSPAVFTCKKICEGVGRGEALYSSDDICFFLTKPENGVLMEQGHMLDSKSVSGKVLIFPSGKGSAVVQDEGLFALKEYGNLPAAMIIEQPDTVLVFGCLLLGIPVVSNVDPDFMKLVSNGASIVVDSDQGKVFLN